MRRRAANDERIAMERRRGPLAGFKIVEIAGIVEIVETDLNVLIVGTVPNAPTEGIEETDLNALTAEMVRSERSPTKEVPNKIFT